MSLFASACLAEFIPVSSYIGQHKSECDSHTSLTGALVQDKIYTFGGCYRIPNIVTPSIFNMYNMFSTPDKYRTNVLDTIQIYDIKKDEWTHETEVKLPSPWRTAFTQTYQQDIYFFGFVDVISENHNKRHIHIEKSYKMWKYDTVLKKFSALDDIPFDWYGDLKTCANNGKMYFVGNGDGRQRNIIRVYNIESGVWEEPLFPNLCFLTEQMICNEDAILVFGLVYNEEENTFARGRREKVYEVIRVDYNTGDAVLSGLSATLSATFKPIIKNNNNKFYFLDVKKKETIITVIDTVASKVTRLEPLPHALVNPLFVPYQDDVLYFFGGGTHCRSAFHDQPESTCCLKKYNHKLILESTASK